VPGSHKEPIRQNRQQEQQRYDDPNQVGASGGRLRWRNEFGLLFATGCSFCRRVSAGSLRCGFDARAHLTRNIGDQTRAGFLYLRWRRRNKLGADRGEKAVTMPRDGLKVERIVGVVAQGCSDLLDALIDALLEVNESVVSPELLLNFVACHQLAGVGGEQRQEFERLGRKFQQRAVFTQFFQVEIELEDSEAQKPVRIAQGVTPRVPQSWCGL